MFTHLALCITTSKIAQSMYNHIKHKKITSNSIQTLKSISSSKVSTCNQRNNKPQSLRMAPSHSSFGPFSLEGLRRPPCRPAPNRRECQQTSPGRIDWRHLRLENLTFYFKKNRNGRNEGKTTSPKTITIYINLDVYIYIYIHPNMSLISILYIIMCVCCCVRYIFTSIFHMLAFRSDFRVCSDDFFNLIRPTLAMLTYTRMLQDSFELLQNDEQIDGFPVSFLSKKLLTRFLKA